MIISASRRTDIPAFYSDWFFNRLNDGFVLVRNPMNFNQVSRVRLTPDVVDGIVFWTKNPAPMLDRLGQLGDYPFYFQFTVTPYGTDIEPFLPPKDEVLTTFKMLSDKIGPERVLWRYDPILISNKYPVDFHIAAFERMAEELYGYTLKATFSFVIQRYKEVQRNGKGMDIQDISDETELELCHKLAIIAEQHDISLEACAEKLVDVESVGVTRACCIDGAQFERITGRKFNTIKDPSQRANCRCVSSIDIGAYNTCKHGCYYCYANYNHYLVSGNNAAHDPEAPLITGAIGEGDKVTERKMYSIIDERMNLV